MASRPVSHGSSDQPSSLRPQRGSRSGLTTGAHTLSEAGSPDGGSWCNARTSVAAASPTARSSARSQLAPSPTACGNTVARPIQAAPCSASQPVWNSARPRWGTAGCRWCSRAIFSAVVSCRSRSVTRSVMPSPPLRSGAVLTYELRP